MNLRALSSWVALIFQPFDSGVQLGTLPACALHFIDLCLRA